MTEHKLCDRFWISGVQLAMIREDIRGMSKALLDLDIDPDCDTSLRIIDTMIMEQKIE